MDLYAYCEYHSEIHVPSKRCRTLTRTGSMTWALTRRGRRMRSRLGVGRNAAKRRRKGERKEEEERLHKGAERRLIEDAVAAEASDRGKVAGQLTGARQAPFAAETFVGLRLTSTLGNRDCRPDHLDPRPGSDDELYILSRGKVRRIFPQDLDVLTLTSRYCHS